MRKFPFAYNTPGILTGAALYTPTVGDILLDAWIEIDTAWDGTTPHGDFGTFVTSHTGIYGYGSTARDMTSAVANIDTGLEIPSFQNVMMSYLLSNGGDGGVVKFTTTDPIKVVVSQNGANNGADPGSTQGEAVLYLVTATPV